uniref:interferon-induced very large GTPase 1 n=1 Tax=Solea senegalensis TaxID=28829 RepID=UPI001CD840B0|nr:interferon-induced very large GTPase 1 [Solea senegalensis]
MSIKLSKRISSKKKYPPDPPNDNLRAQILCNLGLEFFKYVPMDPACMLEISTWSLEDQAPQESKDLPNAFLRRLWLLSPDARSTCCKGPSDAPDDTNNLPEIPNGLGRESQSILNPLDLVTAVFMSANNFLQQEMTWRMVQCQFAVPLVLPSMIPEEPSHFLLWPMRSVVSHWTSHLPAQNERVQEGNLASTRMPMVSCVKLGRCGVSKSQVLNQIITGLKSCNETFVHRGMDGGQLPQTLSNGLVEIGWYVPSEDTLRDFLPVPVVISNLRGDASMHEKCFSLLCQASSVVIVFCDTLREKDKQLLASHKDMASKLIVVDMDSGKNENRVVGFAGLNFVKDMGVPEGSVLQGKDLSEEELAQRLCEILKELYPDKLKLVTLEEAAEIAVELGLNLDEGTCCKQAMATMEKVLKGLDDGLDQFMEKQLPLQGPLWSNLTEIEKKESKLGKEEKQLHLQLRKEKKAILAELRSYKMTPAMKIFTNALFTTDKVERTYFLNWMKLRLTLKQTETESHTHDLFTDPKTESQNGMSEHSDQLSDDQNVTNDLFDSDSFCTDSMFEGEISDEQPVNAGLTENLGSAVDLVPEQELHMTSNGAIQSEGITENCFEEQNQDSDLESDVPLSCQETQQCKHELTIAAADSNPTEQRMHPGVPTEPQVMMDLVEPDQVVQPDQVEVDQVEPDPSSLGLEHFLREMGLIFDFTYISPGIGSQSVLRLPSLAADLLLYGVPLELMDGDASNIPIRWLGCVFGELKRRLPQQPKMRVVTNLGVHHANNAEVLLALFGVQFPNGGKRTTRGVYMVVLCLPQSLRKPMRCDYLLLINVDGLCSPSQDNKINTRIHDNEMVTVATALSNVIMHNIASNASSDFETDFTVIVSALLRIKESGPVPSCQILVQDEDINSLLLASQLKRVCEMLQDATEVKGTNNSDEQKTKNTSDITCIKGPWSSASPSDPVDSQYGKAVLKFKKNVFESLEKWAAKYEATSLPQFMIRLSAVWDALKKESFTTGLQNTNTALAFSLFCIEFSQWEDSFLEHTKSWLLGAERKIFATKERALKAEIQNGLLSALKDEVKVDIKTELDKLKSDVDTYMLANDILKERFETLQPICMWYIDDLRERVTQESMQRLATASESHCSYVQLNKFETLLEKEQESTLCKLLENSKSTKVLLQDEKLEEEFEAVWNTTLSSFEFRPTENENITARVTDILRQNLISRGLHKHMKKTEDISQNLISGFQVYDDHFGYRNRLKKDNNKLQKSEAEQVACTLIAEYKQFVADKSSLVANFSDSYITEILENVEKTLREKSMGIRTAFEVDLKVYLCSWACQDFQKVHDRYAKDKELLTYMTVSKSTYLAKFIYQFRKRDQRHRVAQAFTSIVIKPAVLDYIYGPLGPHIVQDIQSKQQQYQSSRAFNQSLLEELIKEDSFEGFLEYLHCYDAYRQKKVQETLVAYLSESTNVNNWRLNRLGEIVGKIAAAMSQTAEDTNGVQRDTKPLLERVCLILESDADLDVSRSSLDGPLFSIVTEWDHFVKHLMELLAALRLDLAQEFSQKVDVTQLLSCLSDPKQSLFNRVRGCDKRCPLCRAPCEEETKGHQVHRAVFHRPKWMLPFVSVISCPEIMSECDSVQNQNMQSTYVPCRNFLSLNTDWAIDPEDQNMQMSSAYWRYVLVRFREKFLREYGEMAANLPLEWNTVTAEEALSSLKDAYITRLC